MFRTLALVSFTFLAVGQAQQVGTVIEENHPPLSLQQCTVSGCTTLSRNIALDSNLRWIHATSGYDNCYTGNTWNNLLCPDPVTCAQNCALDGANYSDDFGITTLGSGLTLKSVTNANVGSRVYLMANQTHYQTFNLKNQEFTFDVDMSNLPCGVNGALYFVEMDADGGMSKFLNNNAGAKYGTGYCDAQCPHDIKFINGQANVLGWSPSENDPNAGFGLYGPCCNEMDIWEANSFSATVMPHTCSVAGQVRCEGTECGDGDERQQGVCDKDGCDFNSFRMGNRSFLGPGKTVDTTKKFTVVTQFITTDNTTTGDLMEIRRFYVQDGNVIQNSKVNIPGMQPFDSITDDFCAAQKATFGDNNRFAQLGGLKAMGDALERGMVLVIALLADHDTNMLWLDSTYPADADPSQPGVLRGTCPTSPVTLPVVTPKPSVTFSNIKFGAIGPRFGPGSGLLTL